MRFNERQLINISSEKADFEGRLHYKKVLINCQNSKGFKERWFKLKSNLLFYFKLNDTRQLCFKQPSGVFILEDAEVKLEEVCEAPFTFSITFKDDFDRRHLFAGRSDGDVHEWINALKGATFGHLRNRLIFLQERIKEKKEQRRQDSSSNNHPLSTPLIPAAKFGNNTNTSDLSSSMNLIQF